MLKQKFYETTSFKYSILTLYSHSYRLLLCGIVLLIAAALMSAPSYAGSTDVNVKIAQRDFMRVMLSAEYGGGSQFANSIKKYDKTVRFAIINHAKLDRRPAVRSFVTALPKKIRGLKASVVSNPDAANFRIHVVDKRQYARVIRKEIYKDKRAKVQGQCFVRVLPGKKGIHSTDVVIVSDRDERTFNRCLVEEVLQGLGPLADRGHKGYSVFNSASQHSSFTMHDRVLLSALYDPRIKPGMSKAQVKNVISKVIHDCIARLHSS